MSEKQTVKDYIINGIGMEEDEVHTKWAGVWYVLENFVTQVAGKEYIAEVGGEKTFWDQQPIEDVSEQEKYIIDMLIAHAKTSPPPSCEGCPDKDTCGHDGSMVDKDKLI